MNYKQLGRSDLTVSNIGFGCMSLDENLAQNTRLLNRALDLGINYFDTADIYAKGRNESMIGNILYGRRKDCILSTKVGNQWLSDGSGWSWNPGKEYILSAVEESLRRLRTDYIDLYQLHGGTLEDPIDDILEAFGQLQQQGKIRYYGISSIRPSVIREYCRRSGPASVMMQYGLLDRRPEESCLPLLETQGIGVLARGSLAKGLLAGKPPGPWLDYPSATVERAAAMVASLPGPENRKGRTPGQTALRFALRGKGITAVVTGIRTFSQLEEAAATTATAELSENEWETLRLSIPVNYYREHR